MCGPHQRAGDTALSEAEPGPQGAPPSKKTHAAMTGSGPRRAVCEECGSHAGRLSSPPGLETGEYAHKELRTSGTD